MEQSFRPVRAYTHLLTRKLVGITKKAFGLESLLFTLSADNHLFPKKVKTHNRKKESIDRVCNEFCVSMLLYCFIGILLYSKKNLRDLLLDSIIKQLLYHYQTVYLSNESLLSNMKL